MKKFLLYSIFAGIMMFFVACGDSDNVKVRETGQEFMAAVMAGDLDKVKVLVTPETYEKWGNSTNIIEAVMTPELEARLRSVETHVGDVEIHGDEAHAILAVGIPMSVGEVTILHFKKFGNIWLIHEPGILVKNVTKEETVIMDTID